MKNYFVKYSNYFIVIGVILLGMYLFDIVPHRFRNAPDLIRWLIPALFIFIGIVGKSFAYDTNDRNEQINYSKEKEFYSDTSVTSDQSNKSMEEQLNEKKIKSESLTGHEWFKQNPGKSLNDYYKWKNK